MSCNVAEQFRITAGRENVQIAGDRSSYVRFMSDDFFAGLPKLPSKRCLDLLHVAIGAYAVDRLVRRTGHAGEEPAIRSLDLRCAVHDLEFWSQSSISHSIVDIQFLTDEDWDVSFEPIPSQACETGHQYPLGLSKHYQPTRVALYSGGLDSAAGLANRLITGVEKWTRIFASLRSRATSTEKLQRYTRDTVARFQMSTAADRTLTAMKLYDATPVANAAGRPGFGEK
jgi:hypothetical protein